MPAERERIPIDANILPSFALTTYSKGFILKILVISYRRIKKRQM